MGKQEKNSAGTAENDSMTGSAAGPVAEGMKKSVSIAVLGCVVNGPGEASAADIGIAAGKGVGILYRKGEMIRRVKESEIVSVILEEVEKFQPNN